MAGTYGRVREVCIAYRRLLIRKPLQILTEKAFLNEYIVPGFWNSASGMKLHHE